MLDESSTNPRRTFEHARLVEPAHSLSVYGPIHPITVRPKGDCFEMVAGARRLRAAQIAELADVPTRILEFSDEQTVPERSSTVRYSVDEGGTWMHR